jgi:prepilin-type N-terminal cleavage/methylation domain-containing protein
MLTNRLFRRAARIPFRGGFTLVELLVVIGIIAILAGVALGPITTGLKKAQQNSAVQQGHAIGMAMFAFANDNNQLYPDTSNPSAGKSGAAAVAYALLAGNYVTDPAQFWISGGQATKYAGTGSAAASTIAATNISFDFTGAGGGGLGTTQAQYLPLLWNSVGTGAAPSLGGSSAITISPPSTAAFGTTGVSVFYCNESAAFVTALSGVSTVVSASSNTGSAPSGVTTLSGGD